MSVKMVFWDVQHGSATYIKSPNNRHIVIDLGTGSYSGSKEFSPLHHLKNKYGVQKLDYVAVTHPHKDHIDDILNFHLLDANVFGRPRNISESELLEGVNQTDLPKFKKYIELDKRFTGSLENSANDPYTPENYGGLEIIGFSATSCPTTNFNNQSLIRIFNYAQTKVVITGDNEKCSFDELMKIQNFCNAIQNADILLAPHHGRDSGFHSDFVSKVNPSIVIISDGRFCDTSATSRYSEKCNGWKVHRRNGEDVDRKCLTTRSDGVIVVDFGFDANKKPYLSITID